jgi:hypothetical protein
MCNETLKGIFDLHAHFAIIDGSAFQHVIFVLLNQALLAHKFFRLPIEVFGCLCGMQVAIHYQLLVG